MPLLLSTYRCGSPRREGEGLRIGTVRYLPRGVRKENYAREGYFDVWLPVVAPSQEAIRRYRQKGGTDVAWAEFARRYRSEMKKQTDARQTVLLLAALAERTPISIGCYCADTEQCHCTVLKSLIEDAARGRFP
jgi:uncharacterized protein YeaO (DUF488 family)